MWRLGRSKKYAHFAVNLTNLPVYPLAQMGKRLSTMRETWVQSLGQEDPLEKEMAIHSSTIDWKIPWTEEPGRLQSVGLQRVGRDWATSLSLSKCLKNNMFAFDKVRWKHSVKISSLVLGKEWGVFYKHLHQIPHFTLPRVISPTKTCEMLLLDEAWAYL